MSYPQGRAVRRLFSRTAMENKLKLRFEIEPTITEQVNPSAIIDTPFLNLPVDVLLYIYRTISQPATQVCFALTCKTLGRVAALANLNVSGSETLPHKAEHDSERASESDVDAEHDGEQDVEVGYLEDDEVEFAYTGPEDFNDDNLPLVSTFRTTQPLLDGLMHDLPALMLQLRPFMPAHVQLCTHCMTYRPTARSWWVAKRKASDVRAGRPDWGLRQLLICHQDGGGGGGAEIRARFIERCPLCRNSWCRGSGTKSCIGCRMQAEFRKMTRGEY